MSEERQHHRYGMSKLNAYAACPSFESNSDPNQAAEDGTRLHGVMEDVVETYLEVGPANLQAAWETVREGLVQLDEDEAYYLEFCVKNIARLLEAAAKTHIEIRVAIENPDGTELNHGHLDLAVELPEDTAVLFDYKFGWIPVPPADSNLQGMGYALGYFQKFPHIKKVGVMFIQPKLHKVTTTTFVREDIPRMYQTIRHVIQQAQAKAAYRINSYCDFCAVAGTCPALLQTATQAVARYEPLDLPATFSGASIQTAEDAVKALFVIDRLQNLIDHGGVKEKVKEFAKAAGGKLSCQVGDQTFTVEVKERSTDRSLNSPALIAEALKDILTPEQVLGCCKPVLGDLEEVFSETYVEKMKQLNTLTQEEAAQRARLLRADGKVSEAKAVEAEAKAVVKENRPTKKTAKQILESTLLSEGLLSRPDGKIEYIKLKVEKQTKQIEGKTANGN